MADPSKEKLTAMCIKLKERLVLFSEKLKEANARNAALEAKAALHSGAVGHAAEVEARARKLRDRSVAEIKALRERAEKAEAANAKLVEQGTAFKRKAEALAAELEAAGARAKRAEEANARIGAQGKAYKARAEELAARVRALEEGAARDEGDAPEAAAPASQAPAPGDEGTAELLAHVNARRRELELELEEVREAQRLKDEAVTARLERAAQAVKQLKAAVQERDRLLQATRDKATTDIRTKLGIIAQLQSEMEDLRGADGRVAAGREEAARERARADETEERLAAAEAAASDARGRLDEAAEELRMQRLLLAREGEARREDQSEGRRALEAAARVHEREVQELEARAAAAERRHAAELEARAQAAEAELAEARAQLRGSEEAAADARQALEEARGGRAELEAELARVQRLSRERGEEASRLLRAGEEAEAAFQRRLAEAEARAGRAGDERNIEVERVRAESDRVVDELSARLSAAQEALREAKEAEPEPEHRLIELAARREREAKAERVAADELRERVAVAERQREQLEAEVERLLGARSVDVDYLKNVVVKFLAYDATGNEERKALYPVLATILGFDRSDMDQIRDAVNRQSSWWSAVSAWVPVAWAAVPETAAGTAAAAGPSTPPPRGGRAPEKLPAPGTAPPAPRG